MRWSIVCVLLLGSLVLGWLGWGDFTSRRQFGEKAGATVNKQPANFVTRTFDPNAPPAEMPPLSPGEDGECDSSFLSSASVAGETRQTDATHGTVTITRVAVSLQLNVTIWVPTDVTQHVIEHEEGHRQISEYYYQTADKIAERIAATYIRRQVDIAGPNLAAESDEALHKMAVDITDQYNRELNPAPTQLLYDTITDHSRNDVAAKDAVVHALKNVTMEPGESGRPINLFPV